MGHLTLFRRGAWAPPVLGSWHWNWEAILEKTHLRFDWNQYRPLVTSSHLPRQLLGKMSNLRRCSSCRDVSWVDNPGGNHLLSPAFKLRVIRPRFQSFPARTNPRSSLPSASGGIYGAVVAYHGVEAIFQSCQQIHAWAALWVLSCLRLNLMWHLYLLW